MAGWVVLGASSPIARAFAALVAAEGHGVILAGRDTEALQAALNKLGFAH